MTRTNHLEGTVTVAVHTQVEAESFEDAVAKTYRREIIEDTGQSSATKVRWVVHDLNENPPDDIKEVTD